MQGPDLRCGSAQENKPPNNSHMHWVPPQHLVDECSFVACNMGGISFMATPNEPTKERSQNIE
jgi:hypothetical protein